MTKLPELDGTTEEALDLLVAAVEKHLAATPGQSSKCAGLLGALFGHKFEARYSTGAPRIEVTDYGLDVMEATKPRTYCRDVCSRCGAPAGGGK